MSVICAQRTPVETAKFHRFSPGTVRRTAADHKYAEETEAGSYAAKNKIHSGTVYTAAGRLIGLYINTYI